MISIGTPLLWSLFAAFVVVALAIDFFALNKQGAHAVTMREAGVWSILWIAVSFCFVGWLWWYLGGTSADAAASAKEATAAVAARAALVPASSGGACGCDPSAVQGMIDTSLAR